MLSDKWLSGIFFPSTFAATMMMMTRWTLLNTDQPEEGALFLFSAFFPVFGFAPFLSSEKQTLGTL